MTTEIHITEDPPVVTIVQSGPIGPPGVAGGAGTDHDDLTNVTTSQHHVKYTDAEAIAAVGPHTVRYTDPEAVSAMGAEGDVNPLNHARVTDAEIDARAALQDHDHGTPIAAHAADPAAHHARYTDAEADARAALQDHDHASPIAAHAGDASAHHTKYTDAEAIAAVGPHFSGDAVDLGSGAEVATRMIEADGAGNMVFVDKPSGGGGSTLHEDLTDVTTSQHHVRYADSESVTAMGVKGDSNALHHDRYTDAEADARAALLDHDHATPIASHTAIAAAHHAKYLDSEAVTAMGALGDANPLHHDRFALADIPHDPFYNGTFTEPFNATVTSDGATVTMSIEQKGGGDLTERFSDGETVLDCTPAATIALTAGTDSAPQGNWVYVLQSTKALTVSTTTWPTTVEHIKVGYFLVPSAGFVQTNGVMVNQNWNDPATGTDGQGHLSHITERSRLDGAYYFSGLAGAGVDDYLTIVGTTVDLKIDAGVVFQMHRHASPAFDTSASDLVLVKNWSGDPFHDITNLYDIVDDSTGTTIGNNRYFNIVLWAVANKTGEYEPVMINLPSGTYTSQADAENDVDGFDDFTIPREFALDSSTGFLIARVTVQKLASSWSYLSTTDLRGTTPQSASGGGAGGASSPLTTKGDLWGYDTADNRLPVGTDDQVLTADAAEALGVKWAAPAAGGAAIGCSLTKSAVQSIPTGTQTAVTFNGERFDNGGMHDNATNNSRITIPTGEDGPFQFNATIGLELLDAGSFMVVELRKNGTDTLCRTIITVDANDTFPMEGLSIVTDLVAGDYVEATVEHSQGASLDTRTTANGTSFSCHKFGGPTGAAGPAGADGGNNVTTFSQQGAITTDTGTMRFPITAATTVVNVRAMVGTAPTGATLIVDVNKNGTTIYTTQANRPTIAISGTDSGAGTTPDVTALVAGDYLTIDIDQVGSTVAGSDLVIAIETTVG